MAKIEYEVVANTKEAERSIDRLSEKAKKSLDNAGPKYDLVEDMNGDNISQEIEDIKMLKSEHLSLDQIRRKANQNAYYQYQNLKEAAQAYRFQVEHGADASTLENTSNQIGLMANRYRELKLLTQDVDNAINGTASSQSQVTSKVVEQTSNERETTNETNKQLKNEKEIGNEITKNNQKRRTGTSEGRNHSFTLSGIIKKVSRWGLALIGVRSAYSLVTRAVSMVSSRSLEVKEKMEQMGNVIAYAVAPLVKFIVNLLMKAMVYINYITKALFGREIFNFKQATKFSADNMKKTEKHAKGTKKAVKEVSKELAGFDEMNVLTGEKSSDGDGTSNVGGVNGYSNDWFKDIGKIEIPEWLQKLTKWIKDAIDWFDKLDPEFKKLLVGAGLLIGSYVLGGKATGLLGIAGILKGMATLGVIALGVDLVYKDITGRDLIKDLKDIEDYMTRFQKIRKDQNKQTTIDAQNVTKSFNKLKMAMIDNKKAGKQLTEQDYLTIRAMQDQILHLRSLKTRTNAQAKELDNLVAQYGDLYREGVLNNTQMQFYNTLTDKSIKYVTDKNNILKQLIIKQNEEYTASKNQTDAINKENEAYKNSTIWVDKYGISLQNITQQMGLTKDQTTQLQTALEKYKQNPSKEALADLNKEIEKVGKQAGLSKEDIRRLKERISDLKSKKIDVKAEVKTEVDTKSLNNTITKISKGVGNAIKTLFGAKGMVIGYAKGGIIPYASGGIINQPGRGVPLPIGGEHGMEGVIPLTDSQQMALLGEAIGKYITINANIINSMNGRVISRELQKIQNEEAFGSNRW